MAATPIHLVSKINNALTTIGYLDQSSLPTLTTPNSVRVRTQLISLSSNNLTYALAGDRFGWWSAYPVPTGTKLRPSSSTATTAAAAKSQQHQDEQGEDLNKKWGIVPAWGYAAVLESTHASIEKGSLLWGFWPTSSHIFDLTLSHFTASENGQQQPETHFQEVSEHRKGLMGMYNRYVLVTPPSPVELDLDSDLAAETVLARPVFECGVLLESYTFHRERATHPLGLPKGAPANTIPGVGAWTEKDADLRKAVVISLSAGTKTARAFTWQLARERDMRGELESEGPKGLVQVTSVPDTLADFGEGTKLEVKNVGYSEDDLKSVVEWVQGLEGVEKVVMVDFGAAASVTETLVNGFKSVSPGLVVLVMAVGNEAKVYAPEEIQARMASGQKLGKVQFNTSGVRDRAMEVEGAEKYFDGVEECWKRCYGEKGLGEVKFGRYEGVEGEKGVEGAWKALCERRLKANEGVVVRL
ncbi:hypothetical protein B0T20DRAFT_197885 [Sordaria brevicollis]|uniref:Uncharacterized protein n=1 Tax=Sordaria brevicollis TaxID=83679 RepID=A0AAE0UCR9_SORBR|nr:hypothetical protein B0T20DRAFT_197885 [Sordaria brevicollis]